MEIIVNGNPHHLLDGMTIADFIATYEMDTRFVAVARNGSVVGRQAFSTTYICEGDRLEIVRPVGGG